MNTYNRYFEARPAYGWDSLELEGTGKVKADGFQAVRTASQFPFRPTAHKMIVLIMTKAQVSGVHRS